MKRLAIYTYSIYTIGGEQRVVDLLTNELSKYYEVTLYTMDSDRLTDGPFEINQSITVKRYHPYTCDAVSFLYRAMTHLTPKIVYDRPSSILERAYCTDKYARLMADQIGNNYDTVIVTSWQLSIVLGKAVKLGLIPMNTKTIAWEHSSYTGYFETKYKYLYNHNDLFADNVKYIDEVIVLNDDYARQYANEMGINCRTVYNPKTFNSIVKSKVNSKQMFVCGRASAEKGLDLLIEAFDVFAHKNCDWNIVIAGDGPELTNIKSKAKEAGLENRIIFLGQINNVADKMLESSIFLMPSRWEGFPMAATEACECGVPILAFDINAMKPFVDCGAAIAVPAFDIQAYADAMLELADNYEQRVEMGKAGIAFADTLDIEAIGKKWCEVIG